MKECENNYGLYNSQVHLWLTVMADLSLCHPKGRLQLPGLMHLRETRAYKPAIHKFPLCLLPWGLQRSATIPLTTAQFRHPLSSQG